MTNILKTYAGCGKSAADYTGDFAYRTLVGNCATSSAVSVEPVISYFTYDFFIEKKNLCYCAVKSNNAFCLQFQLSEAAVTAGAECKDVLGKYYPMITVSTALNASAAILGLIISIICCVSLCTPAPPPSELELTDTA